MHVSILSSVLSAAIFVGGLTAIAVLHPASPLPTEWNPAEPLRVSDPKSLITKWKASRAIGILEQCVAAMDTADVTPMSPLEVSEVCGIARRVRLSRVGGISMVPFETDCAIALQLALWERHDLRGLSREMLGADISRIDHFSSYSCRRMRTSAGETRRMSTHASGKAIDVRAFGLSDGRTIEVRRDWVGGGSAQSFLRGAQASACRWFGGVLGPDYNDLHTDHFHMQANDRGFCR